MPKKFWEFFTERFELTSLVVNVLLIFLAVELHAFGSDVKLAAAILATLVALVAFDWKLKQHHDRRIMRLLHSEFIDSLLEAAVKSISRVTGVNHMRGCLMIKDGDTLRITNCYNFSEDDLDRGIRVSLGTGVAGKAWVQEKVVIADLHQRSFLMPGDPDWSIPHGEDEKVRKSLNSILSFPIKGGHPYRMLAILNLDSDHSMADTRFFDDDIQHIAYCFNRALASLLDQTD